ncbi:hypothetical protein GQ55_4G131900 [Panicum hallii var. hallii]|uniref:Uncharacterized protein n=1 Tax=Panicum hallii var. hallii TaxID=1504633 RepID=A0A2T7DY31_9POAL|nr:hypothetical protein GQ55_4G131900 [Panicum hallii var. hallii]
MHPMGARRFAFINVGLVGCVPGARVLSPAGACWDDLNHFAGGFNDALRCRLAGLVYSLADSFGFTRNVLADPRASEYADVAGACCGAGAAGWPRRRSAPPTPPHSAPTATGMSSGTARTCPSGPLLSSPGHSTMGRLGTPPLPSTSCNWPGPVS